MKIEVGKEYKVLKDGLKEGLKEGQVGTVVDIDSLGVCTLRHVCTGGWTESLIESCDLTTVVASKPAHYDTAIDTIAFAKANFTPEQVEGFMRINVIKYVQRYPKKNGADDIRKAIVYLNELLKHVEGEEK